MTAFLNKSFSVAMGLNEQGRANYERIFGKKKPKHSTAKKPAKPSAAAKAKAKAADRVDQIREEKRVQRERYENAPPWNGKNQGQL